ncbi:MAG: trigger factor [Gemmatimonadota bacterium]
MTEITYQTTAEDIASKSLAVTVPLERLAAAERRAVREYTRQARLPGFRKGHAPEPVVRKKFEQEIKRSVLEDALRESWETILKETGLQPTGDPQVRNVHYHDGAPLTFDLLIEVRPALTLTTTGGFTLTRTVPAVTDEMVQEQLEKIREQKATWSPLDAVQPKPGNLVSVTVTTLEEGKEPAESQPYGLVLGEGQTIPDVEEQIMQLLPGGVVDADVRFPEDHPEAARRGESRRVRIALHEVKEQQLPALDDAFARELGDFDSLEALRTRIREDLDAEAVRSADQGVRDQLVQRLIEANAVPAPPSLVHRLVHAYAEGYRIEAAQFETFASSFEPVAQEQVKRELVLDAVTTAQNLRASEDDLDARIAEMAAARGVEPGKLYASLQQGKRLGELERTITEEKVFHWLLEQSTVTEVTA